MSPLSMHLQTTGLLFSNCDDETRTHTKRNSDHSDNRGSIWSQTYLPTSDLFIAIFSIESRFHLTVGVGLPDARHRSVTFEPSRTITSLELSESSMFGGTRILFGRKRMKRDSIFLFGALWRWRFLFSVVALGEENISNQN